MHHRFVTPEGGALVALPTDLAPRTRRARADHPSRRRKAMLSWALAFLVIAIVAAVLGFGGIAGTAAGIAKILFIIFLVLFVVSFIMGRRSG